MVVLVDLPSIKLAIPHGATNLKNRRRKTAAIFYLQATEGFEARERRPKGGKGLRPEASEGRLRRPLCGRSNKIPMGLPVINRYGITVAIFICDSKRI